MDHQSSRSWKKQCACEALRKLLFLAVGRASVQAVVHLCLLSAPVETFLCGPLTSLHILHMRHGLNFVSD